MKKMLNNLLKLTILSMTLVFVSCGGGGSVSVGSNGTGDVFSGAEVTASEITVNQLPGTVTMEASSAGGHYMAVVEIGSGVSMTDNVTESGRYELKNHVVFGN